MLGNWFVHVFLITRSIPYELLFDIFQLAKLHYLEGNFVESLENLDQARRVATREGFGNELKRILCLMGISQGAIEFREHADLLVNSLEYSGC